MFLVNQSETVLSVAKIVVLSDRVVLALPHQVYPNSKVPQTPNHQHLQFSTSREVTSFSAGVISVSRAGSSGSSEVNASCFSNSNGIPADLSLEALFFQMDNISSFEYLNGRSWLPL